MVGGDVDTTAAIVGGIVGARLGMDSIPSNWVACVHDINIWNADQLRDMCQQVAQYKITY
jgi:ADP-ribosylglycohydrolase